ncbi:hypothetical protein BZA77DRAFT_310386 [Pyronema omphalodes]|nr:hypothetical protein BZA77DRAFT_310386 [Pyronema omphalodes]
MQRSLYVCLTRVTHFIFLFPFRGVSCSCLLIWNILFIIWVVYFACFIYCNCSIVLVFGFQMQFPLMLLPVFMLFMF